MFLFMQILKKEKHLFISINNIKYAILIFVKKSVLFLLTLILTSCNKEESYSNICYQCFYGNELELSLKTDYELSEDKIKMQNDITSISDQFF